MSMSKGTCSKAARVGGSGVVRSETDVESPGWRDGAETLEELDGHIFLTSDLGEDSAQAPRIDRSDHN